MRFTTSLSSKCQKEEENEKHSNENGPSFQSFSTQQKALSP